MTPDAGWTKTMLALKIQFGDRLPIDHQTRLPEDALWVVTIEHGRQRGLLRKQDECG
jgi:hypothetical protein